MTCGLRNRCSTTELHRPVLDPLRISSGFRGFGVSRHGHDTRISPPYLMVPCHRRVTPVSHPRCTHITEFCYQRKDVFTMMRSRTRWETVDKGQIPLCKLAEHYLIICRTEGKNPLHASAHTPKNRAASSDGRMKLVWRTSQWNRPGSISFTYRRSTNPKDTQLTIILGLDVSQQLYHHHVTVGRESHFSVKPSRGAVWCKR